MLNQDREGDQPSLASAAVLALVLCAILNYMLFVVSSIATHHLTLYPWDSGWYKSIVEHGYSFNGRYNQAQNIAFTPAYPLLCRAVEHIFATDTSLAMHLVSSVCFIITIFFFYLLIARLFSKPFALATTVVYATNPFTLFQLFGYGDVVFVTSVVLFFYFLEIRHSLFGAAICTSIAAVSRPYGILLLLPLIVGIAIQNWDFPRAERFRCIIRKCILHVPVATLGFLLYTFWSQHVFGDPLAFLHIHDAWNVPCQAQPWLLRLNMTNLIASMQPVFSRDLINPPGIAALFVVSVSILGVVTGVYRHLPLSMTAYWLALTGFLLIASTGCHPNLVALGRHTLGILPLFIILMLIVARLCEYPITIEKYAKVTSAPAYALLSAGAVITLVNLVLLCNYIYRFFSLQWVA